MTIAIVSTLGGIVIAIISFWGGRKTNIDKLKIKADIRKTEFESLQVELNALRDFRNLLISDNESMLKELRAVKSEQKDLKEEISTLKKLVADLIDTSCKAAKTCKIRQ